MNCGRGSGCVSSLISLLLMTANFCLCTGLTIMVQPRNYIHMSTTEVQSQNVSSWGSATAPLRAKRCCSQGDYVPGKVSIILSTRGLSGASFWQIQASTSAEDSLPTVPLRRFSEVSQTAKDLINIGLPQFSCCVEF